MLHGWLESLVGVVTRYPEWAFFVIFVVAFAESLAGIGLVIPGTIILFSLGALVGLGALDFWTAAIACTAGGIAGDLLSFWAGRRFREPILRLWPFSKYPQPFNYCQKLFERHGGKSYFFGRFFGPLRAFMALIAGMMQMPWPRFVLLCVFACALWAPLYLAPGIAFGTSLELAGDAAGRLVVVILVIGALGLGLRWIAMKGLVRQWPKLPEFAHESIFAGAMLVIFSGAAAVYFTQHPCESAKSCANIAIGGLTNWSF